MDVDNGVQPMEDFFGGEDSVGDGYGGADAMAGNDFAGENQSSESPGFEAKRNLDPGGFVPFDPRRAPNERDLVLAMTDADDEGVMDYFDQNFLKNWAGPEHWKLRKVVRRRKLIRFLLTSAQVCVVSG